MKKKITPLAKHLAHRHKRLWAYALLGLAVVGGLSFLDHQGHGLYPGSEMRQFHGRTLSVMRVIDGDTIDLWDAARSEQVRVRLWGMDTPELARPRQNRQAQRLAVEAMEYVQSVCDGQAVRIELEPHRVRGRYGRLLCYVWLPNGNMLNEQLLLRGLARVDSRFAHQHANRFVLLQEQAKYDRVGLWAKKKPTTP